MVLRAFMLLSRCQPVVRDRRDIQQRQKEPKSVAFGALRKARRAFAPAARCETMLRQLRNRKYSVRGSAEKYRLRLVDSSFITRDLRCM